MGQANGAWRHGLHTKESVAERRRLNDLVREGLVRNLGASNFAAWQFAKALGLAALHNWEPFISLQPTYSLITRDFERELLPLCQEEGIAVIPYGPLAGGMLTGKYRADEEPAPDTRAGGEEAVRRGMAFRMTPQGYEIASAVREIADELGRTPAQVALNWVLHRPTVTAPILGARTVEQLLDNLDAVGWRLDERHDEQLTKISMIDLGYPLVLHQWMAQLGL